VGFNSIAFLVFLPIVLGTYYVLRHRAQNVWLLGASYVFYGFWDPRFLLLLLLSTAIDYACGLAIADANDARRRHAFLFISVASNLTILAAFKYFNFFIGSAGRLLSALHIGLPVPVLGVVLPVGISFYTFQEMSYTIDIYRGVFTPRRDFVTFALSVAYFPHLVAGPIQRASGLLPQLERPRRVGWTELREGAALIVLGYFKKVGVADAVAPTVELCFANPHHFSGSDLLFGLYLFAIQIYCDFSGYSDIARGVSKLFGIELMINFERPYFAASITEFWRRWHISLSTWLRDYLYIPLGGNRRGRTRTSLNLLTTMLLGGLWHGASWTFVVWGGLHGLYLSVEKALSVGGRPAKAGGPDTIAARAVKTFVTFQLVALTWVFFRAADFRIAWQYLHGIVTWQVAPVDAGVHWLGRRFLVLFAALFAIDLLQETSGDQTVVLRWHWALRGIAFATAIVLMLALGGTDVHVPFIYFQF
jgi:D-alanyl-lipoteichoic acid acyltransferase DltB (MBOAT superfamily)